MLESVQDDPLGAAVPVTVPPRLSVKVTWTAELPAVTAPERLRALLAEDNWAAHRAGDLEVTMGRASDYFGPETPNAAIFHTRFFERLSQGKAVEVMGDPDQPHSYSYTPDVARGLATLGTDDRAVGKVWYLPVAAQLSTRELIERFAAAAGVEAKVRQVPTWLLKATGLFVPLMRAVAEMVYQWETPYVVDDSRFRSTFGIEPSDLEVAIGDTLDSLASPAAVAA